MGLASPRRSKPVQPKRPWALMWRYQRNDGGMHRWRLFGTYATRGNAEGARERWASRWKHKNAEWQIIEPGAPREVREPDTRGEATSPSLSKGERG